MNKKIATKSRSNTKPVDKNNTSDKFTILSFQKFVLEISRGLDRPYLTTGFAVASNQKSGEYIVIDPTPYSPFMSQTDMHKIAIWLYGETKDEPMIDRIVYASIPKVFSLNRTTSSIVNTRACNMLFGNLLCPLLVSHKRTPFSDESNNVTTMALNTKVHFGNDKGEILIHNENDFPIVGMYRLEDLSPLHGGALVISTGSSSVQRELKFANLAGFTFVDNKETTNKNMEVLELISDVSRRSTEISSRINAVSQYLSNSLITKKPEASVRKESNNARRH